jgi:hypothetical protein
MRRLVGTIALLALVALPPIARARFFCRYTGIEITDCEEQRVPDRPVVQVEDCCERRIVPPLAAARICADDAAVAPILFAVAPAFHALPVLPSVDTPVLSKASGPPLYVVQGALLI